jgi:hypothetical protein
MDEDKIKPVASDARNKMVETYADDMAKVIENDTEGLVKKIIHGEELHEAEKRNLSPESKKNRFFMLVSIFLIIVALAIFSFFFFNKNPNTLVVQPQFVPLVFNDQSAFLEIAGLKKDEIAQTVLTEAITTKVKAGGVEGIYLTENKQVIGLRRFISLIQSHFIPGASTLLVNDNFLLGVVKNPAISDSPSDTGFFMLLKVRSTADIFNPLKAWETNLLTDLHGFFGINISSDTGYLFTKDFEDGIIENKNARILYDKDGNIVLMYIFADDNSVIVTDSQNAAQELILSLAAGRTKQ